MRYEVIIPAAPARREYADIIKADSEQHARNIIKQWLGHQAAVEAIVRPVTETLQMVVERKVNG